LVSITCFAPSAYPAFFISALLSRRKSSFFD
jgi:hypothetical protein